MTRWTGAAIVLLALSASAQIAYGLAAIGGLDALEENVRRIESTPGVGNVFLSLGAWGAILVTIGLSELAAARLLARRSPYGRILGLVAALVGFGASCFTLALFRVAAVLTILLQLAALYVLSYRVADPET